MAPFFFFTNNTGAPLMRYNRSNETLAYNRYIIMPFSIRFMRMNEITHSDQDTIRDIEQVMRELQEFKKARTD